MAIYQMTYHVKKMQKRLLQNSETAQKQNTTMTKCQLLH